MTAPAPPDALGALPAGLADDLATASLTLARRIAGGATLWCASPAWPHHAQHVAVEFVHPVIVGKPAVPAVALPAAAPATAARANCRSGDVLVAIGRADDAVLRDLLRRAPAWGVTSVWVGAGDRPGPGAADHVLWLPDPDAAPHDGRFILLYHLLWELSHVCLEHAGLMTAGSTADGPVCVTCSDEGRLAEVVRTAGSTARVRTCSGYEDVDVTLVGAVGPHDLLLVHAGSAITRLEAAP